MGLKISTGVKTKTKKGFNEKTTVKQTFFVNVFPGLVAMQEGKAILTVKADSFASLMRALNTAGHKFAKLSTNDYSLHNGWTKSQTTKETRRGLCLDKEQFAEVRSALEDLLVKPNSKVIPKNQMKHELIKA